MATQKLVTLLDRWVTRGQPGRSTTENAQPKVRRSQRQRQHHQQNQHKIPRTTLQDKEAQQLTLQGHNLDLQDGEEYGDKITPKSPSTFRIVQQNIKLVPENPKAYKNKQISNFISNGDAACT